MRLDWNDIKARAATFADAWKDAAYERGETQTFYNEFFELFGVPRKRVASFETGVHLAAGKRGFLDLFWKGKLLVEQKSAGRDLRAAKKQALDEAVDRLYRAAPFASDRERVEHLFMLYEKLTADLLTATAKPKRRKRMA
ncbi:MAG: type IIL restriction-modification enzyme MmeI [Beijerinckiaceae bacterium]